MLWTGYALILYDQPDVLYIKVGLNWNIAVYSLDGKARLTVAVGDEMTDYTARSTYGDMWNFSSQGNHG